MELHCSRHVARWLDRMKPACSARQAARQAENAVFTNGACAGARPTAHVDWATGRARLGAESLTEV